MSSNHPSSGHAIGYFQSKVGRKQIVALTGLVWVLFVFVHMAGNCLIFAGPEAYNSYSHALTSNHLLLYTAEAILLASLIIHVLLTVQITIENRRTKGLPPSIKTNRKKAADFGSRTLIYQGSIVLAFIILHLITFKYGTYYSVVYHGEKMRDLYRLVIEVFANPIYVTWYVVALVFVGIHLSHGFESIFKTAGYYHPVHSRRIKTISYIYAIVVAAGFISQPLFVFLKGIKG